MTPLSRLLGLIRRRRPREPRDLGRVSQAAAYAARAGRRWSSFYGFGTERRATT